MGKYDQAESVFGNREKAGQIPAADFNFIFACCSQRRRY